MIGLNAKDSATDTKKAKIWGNNACKIVRVRLTSPTANIEAQAVHS